MNKLQMEIREFKSVSAVHNNDNNDDDGAIGVLGALYVISEGFWVIKSHVGGHHSR